MVYLCAYEVMRDILQTNSDSVKYNYTMVSKSMLTNENAGHQQMMCSCKPIIGSYDH